MNWVKYLVNQLELDCREAQDQGYKFHFSWLLILIAFIAWEMPEGATFPDIEPFEPLAAKFSTLWYSSDMNKQWQSNVVFHTYYNQLKVAIQSAPRITPNTLHRFRPLMKFSADHHFIYITARADEHKQQLQSYYKLTEEDLEEITKDWSVDLLIPADPAEISDIDSPETAQDTPGPSRIKKTEEVQDLDSASMKTASISPEQGGDGREIDGTEVEQKKGEVTPPRDEEDPSKKRKVSPPKPSSRKKSKASMTKMQTILTSDDFDFIIAALNDASLEIAEKQEAKKEAMYNRIEIELQGVQQALQSSRAVSTAPLPLGTPELGDEPAQLHRIVDTVEAHLRRAQEETTQATQALTQVQGVLVEKRSTAEWEKLALQAKFDEEKSQLQKEKEQLLTEQLEVKEMVNRALRSVTVVEVKAEERIPQQVVQLEEVIQQLQQRIADLELRAVPETPQDVRDQREATARSAVERLKALAGECKQLSNHSAQTYEKLTENPELQALESQLQEAKQHTEILQAQLKALSVVERMKRSQEKRTVQQQIHTIQRKVMEVTQWLQPVQDKAYQLFTEVESRGAELEQVVNAAEQCLEGPVNDVVIQEFTEQEVVAQQQVEAARAKLEAFEAELVRPE
jgi:hypothetical protein